MIKRPPPASRVAVSTASTLAKGKPFEPMAEAVAPRSMNFSTPELTKINAIRTRPMPSIASFTPAAARISACVGSPVMVCTLIGHSAIKSLENARWRGAVPCRTYRGCGAILYTAGGSPVHGRGRYYPMACDSFARPRCQRDVSRGFFMRNVGRKLAFVLAATNHGTMITNRFDYRASEPNSPAGIADGCQILESGTFDPVEVELALHLIEARRGNHGDGVVAVDGGAHIGAHTVEWAIAMTGWGSVIAIEA